MFLSVVDVQYLNNYRLRLSFSDGVVKDADLQDELYGEVFEPLRDTALFQQVAVNPDTNTVQWPSGADFAPEFLYSIGTEVSRTNPVAA